MKHFFFLILLTISGSAFSQQLFYVYDSFTLELVDSVDVTANKDKVESRTVSFGIYKVENVKKGMQLTFTRPGYAPQVFDCSDDKAESYSIILDPSESLVKAYRAKLPYYGRTSVTDKKEPEKAAETQSLSVTVPAPEDSILSIVDQQPDFPGGRPALMNYLMNNIRYPQEALELEISGKVYLQFVVSATGKVSNVRIVRGVNSVMDGEAYRVVKAMPDWTPGYVNGKPVNCYFALPISFKLQ
ncbi:MAG: energy transducer TonB [Bacteroidota bacterium]